MKSFNDWTRSISEAIKESEVEERMLEASAIHAAEEELLYQQALSAESDEEARQQAIEDWIQYGY
jgi:replication fork clamp-binding protein CrfC